MKKQFLYSLRVLIVALLLTGGALALAFTAPTATPPGNNALGPLNSSITPQKKGTGTIPFGSLFHIEGTASANTFFTWNDATINNDLTVDSLRQPGWSTGLRPVCLDATSKLIICAPICGNTFIENGEQCDDGNTANNDGCSSTCQSEVPIACGNNVIEAGEQCDDGGTVNGDGCSSTCQLEAVCGNNIIEAGEQCDDGGTVNGDGCDNMCQSEAPIQYYTHQDNLGAVMGICHLMPDPYGGQPGYVKATRDAATEANAAARGVTKVDYTFRIRTDNYPSPQTSAFTATFFPGDLEIDLGISQIDHDGGGYCSAVACDGFNCPEEIQEYF